jgi:hypothetical protein
LEWEVAREGFFAHAAGDGGVLAAELLSEFGRDAEEGLHEIGCCQGVWRARIGLADGCGGLIIVVAILLIVFFIQAEGFFHDVEVLMRGNYGRGFEFFSPVGFECVPKDLTAEAEEVFFVIDFVDAQA